MLLPGPYPAGSTGLATGRSELDTLPSQLKTDLGHCIGYFSPCYDKTPEKNSLR